MYRPIQLAWTESADELRRRYRAARRVEEKRRLHALWLVRLGASVEDAGRACGVGGRTVYRWLSWYREGGLKMVLSRLPRHGETGGPGRLNDVQRQVLLNQCAGGALRSCGEAREWVKAEFGVDYQYQGMYAALRRLGVRLNDAVSGAADAQLVCGGISGLD